MRRRRRQDRISVLPRWAYTSSKRFRKRGTAPGLMAIWAPTLTSRLAQFAGDNPYTFFRFRVFYPQQILGQRLAEAAMDLPDAVACDRTPL